MSAAALHQDGPLQRRSPQQAEEEKGHEKEKRQIGLVHYLKWNNQYFQEKKVHLEEQP